MKATIVLPTYNESLNLERLVSELFACENVGNVVIVDDDSPDGTGAIADTLPARHAGRVFVLHRRGTRGYSAATREGMAIAINLGADCIVQMDADGSHNPIHLHDMLRAMEQADLVIGSRYVHGGRVVNWPLRRRCLSRFANAYVRRIVHLRTDDCTSGFRAWRPSLLQGLLARRRAWSDGYAFLVEMLVLAEREHARIVEVPIAFIERQEGRSKMSWRIIAESAIVPWALARQSRESAEAGESGQGTGVRGQGLGDRG
jgi:dolichol-phosphate mannosyltransferase